MLAGCFAAACAGAVALAAAHCKRGVRRAAQSALCGCCALGLVNALSAFTGVAIALNYATAFIAVVLGAPGVVLLLALRPLLGQGI